MRFIINLNFLTEFERTKLKKISQSPNFIMLQKSKFFEISGPNEFVYFYFLILFYIIHLVSTLTNQQ